MRKIVIGGLGLVLGVSTVLASGAFAGGNGAWHLWLQATQASNNNQCDQATANANQGLGFANVNAPGQPGSAKFVNGEISLKDADPSAGPYTIYIANSGDDSSCMPEGMIEPNAQGNGNAHLMDAGLHSGDYYIVIRNNQDKEVLATQDANVQ